MKQRKEFNISTKQLTLHNIAAQYQRAVRAKHKRTNRTKNESTSRRAPNSSLTD